MQVIHYIPMTVGAVAVIALLYAVMRLTIQFILPFAG